VDRLWPRGKKKEEVDMDYWMKDIAPDDDLRKWFHEHPEKWSEFKEKYFKELEEKAGKVNFLLEKGEKKHLIFLYASKDEEHNNAIALKEYLEKKADE
jgi:uncharacterized protein YeaO (DUF488 family)